MVAIHPKGWNKCCCCCSVVPEEEEFQPCPSTDRWDSPSRASFLCQVILSNNSNSHHTGLPAWSLCSLFKGSTGWQHERVWVPQDSLGNYPFSLAKEMTEKCRWCWNPACMPWSVEQHHHPSLHCSDSVQFATTHTSELLQFHPQSTIWLISPE